MPTHFPHNASHPGDDPSAATRRHNHIRTAAAVLAIAFVVLGAAAGSAGAVVFGVAGLPLSRTVATAWVYVLAGVVALIIGG